MLKTSVYIPLFSLTTQLPFADIFCTGVQPHLHLRDAGDKWNRTTNRVMAGREGNKELGGYCLKESQFVAGWLGRCSSFVGNDLLRVGITKPSAYSAAPLRPSCDMQHHILSQLISVTEHVNNKIL